MRKDCSGFWIWEEKAGEEAREKITQRRKGTQRRGRSLVALDRKSPPFIPQKARDGEEFAKGAKDGAPSSSHVGWPNEGRRPFGVARLNRSPVSQGWSNIFLVEELEVAAEERLELAGRW